MAVDEQHRQSFEEQLKKANESNPFMIHNHIRATVLSEKTSQVRAEIGADALNAMGGVHGGLMFVMAEIAAGLRPVYSPAPLAFGSGAGWSVSPKR